MVFEQGQPQWEVEAILEHQAVPVKKGGRKHRHVVPDRYRITAYFVKFAGFERAEWIENTQENQASCSELIEAYRKSKGLNEPEYV